MLKNLLKYKNKEKLLLNKFDLFVTVGEYDFDIVEHTINFNKNKLDD